ncbi:hypothetical protein IW245_002687 [Longispora fulva]|uniref:Uncharacterized protein n=1 Tax=Longispora fulva TaxID=619741 RepID=A0A8J7GHP4_9ACTN|nr:hypothetical protein [Longispora fulva]
MSGTALPDASAKYSWSEARKSNDCSSHKTAAAQTAAGVRENLAIAEAISGAEPRAWTLTAVARALLLAGDRARSAEFISADEAGGPRDHPLPRASRRGCRPGRAVAGTSDCEFALHIARSIEDLDRQIEAVVAVVEATAGHDPAAAARLAAARTSSPGAGDRGHRVGDGGPGPGGEARRQDRRRGLAASRHSSELPKLRPRPATRPARCGSPPSPRQSPGSTKPVRAGSDTVQTGASRRCPMRPRAGREVGQAGRPPRPAGRGARGRFAQSMVASQPVVHGMPDVHQVAGRSGPRSKQHPTSPEDR